MIRLFSAFVVCATAAGLVRVDEDVDFERSSSSSDAGFISILFDLRGVVFSKYVILFSVYILSKCAEIMIFLNTVSGDMSFGGLEMDWSNPTLGWSSEAMGELLSDGDWTTLDTSFDSSSSSSSEWTSSSEWITSEEWSITEEDSSMSLSAWFTDTQDSWAPYEPHSMSEDALITGVTGYYEIDHTLYPSEEQNGDWHHVEINWNHDKGSFTWENRAGVSWTLTPIHGVGGWDTTKLAVGSDCTYYNEGHHFATLEWVSYE